MISPKSHLTVTLKELISALYPSIIGVSIPWRSGACRCTRKGLTRSPNTHACWVNCVLLELMKKVGVHQHRAFYPLQARRTMTLMMIITTTTNNHNNNNNNNNINNNNNNNYNNPHYHSPKLKIMMIITPMAHHNSIDTNSIDSWGTWLELDRTPPRGLGSPTVTGPSQ